MMETPGRHHVHHIAHHVATLTPEYRQNLLTFEFLEDSVIATVFESGVLEVRQ
jgi:hypothetical protein